jgi:hypothetical protein
MKKILFIPTYTYLSSPIFTHLLPELKEFETLYLDVEDQYHCEKTSVEFKNQFNKLITLSMDTKNKTFIDNIIKFFKMLDYQNRLRKYISFESPSAIVTTSDLTFSVRIIKKYFPNIPIFVIQPALFSNRGISSTFFHTIASFFTKVIHVPLVSRQNFFGQEFDNIFLLLWGEYFQNMLPNNKNIHIVGDITFDDFPIKKDYEAKKEFLEEVGYPLDSKIITICTSVLENFTGKETINSLYDIYKNLIVKRKDLFFIIKPHPRNNTKELRDIFESLQVENCIVLNTDLHELFKYTDIHISTFSRTAVEAIASNIPIVSVNPDNQIQLQDFLNNELKEKVTNSQEMYDKIDDIIKNRDDYLALGEQYIEDKLYKLDGKSAQRATDIIKREIAI